VIGRKLAVGVGVVVLIVALAFVNRLVNGPDAQSSAPPPPAPSKPLPPGGMSRTTGPSGEVPTELTIGNPSTAKLRVTLGFTADESVEEHTEVANQAIQAAVAWAKSHPGDSLQVVCVDIPPSLRADPSTANAPIGIAVNGSPISGSTGNIGSGLQAPQVAQALNTLAP
jgi:hypothetical protein